MPNLLTPVDLEAVTGGAAVAPRSTTSSSDSLLQTLTTLQSTIQNIGNTAHSTGFSTTDVLLLGLLLSQRSSVNVFVRRPFW